MTPDNLIVIHVLLCRGFEARSCCRAFRSVFVRREQGDAEKILGRVVGAHHGNLPARESTREHPHEDERIGNQEDESSGHYRPSVLPLLEGGHNGRREYKKAVDAAEDRRKTQGLPVIASPDRTVSQELPKCTCTQRGAQPDLFISSFHYD